MGCCRYMARANAPIGSEIRSRREAIGYVAADLSLNPANALFDNKPVGPLTSLVCLALGSRPIKAVNPKSAMGHCRT